MQENALACTYQPKFVSTSSVSTQLDYILTLNKHQEQCL